MPCGETRTSPFVGESIAAAAGAGAAADWAAANCPVKDYIVYTLGIYHT